MIIMLIQAQLFRLSYYPDTSLLINNKSIPDPWSSAQSSEVLYWR